MSNAICRQNLDFAGYYMWLAVKMYTLVGSMFFFNATNIDGPLVFVNTSFRVAWIYGSLVVVFRKGGENKRTSLVVLLCLSFCYKRRR